MKEGYDDNKKIEKIIKKDEEELFSILDKAIAEKGETIKNIIVVGHDPVITLKTKKKYTLNQNGLDLLKKIYTKIDGTKNYYLCADTHQYQKVELKLYDTEFTQYVVGTGGTELDTQCLENNESFTTFGNIKYKLEECIESFGYLECTENGTSIEFKFVKLPPKERRKGRKTRKKRKKKKKRKTKKSGISGKR
jgi:hypothetical protein